MCTKFVWKHRYFVCQSHRPFSYIQKQNQIKKNNYQIWKNNWLSLIKKRTFKYEFSSGHRLTQTLISLKSIFKTFEKINQWNVFYKVTITQNHQNGKQQTANSSNRKVLEMQIHKCVHLRAW